MNGYPPVPRDRIFSRGDKSTAARDNESAAARQLKRLLHFIRGRAATASFAMGCSMAARQRFKAAERSFSGRKIGAFDARGRSPEQEGASQSELLLGI